MTLVLGIDEAGRGPVLGPMVVAGVLIEKKDEARLRSLGVKDSKMLSPQRRTKLAKEIRKLAAGIESIKISAKQLDELMQLMTINQIELNAMAEIINRLDGGEIYIDLPSTSPSFIAELSAKKKNKEARIIAEHKADSKYVVVGAASIIAKTGRDAEISQIQKKYESYGDIGSGYPADARTMDFLKKYLAEHKNLPPEARKSWATAENLLKNDAKNERQRTLA